MSYSSFARYYDVLTHNVNYEQRANYICQLLQKYGHSPGISLDLACGTGNMTLALAERRFDVYGVDNSASMLSVAQQKAAEKDLSILFLCQDMRRLDLFGTVDTVVCALDSINHLNSEAEILNVFQRVSLFLNPDGYFIFDMNTIFKHRNILANQIFIYDMETVYCVWQNHLNKRINRISITLDLFGREEGGTFRRSTEHFFERAYKQETIVSLLLRAGLDTVDVFDDLTFQPPHEQSERIVFVAKKR